MHSVAPEDFHQSYDNDCFPFLLCRRLNRLITFNEISLAIALRLYQLLPQQVHENVTPIGTFSTSPVQSNLGRAVLQSPH